MRLFINSQSNSNEVAWNMEGLTDQTQVEAGYGDWTHGWTVYGQDGADAWRVENSNCHGGVRTSSVQGIGVGGFTEYYHALITEEQTDVIEYSWYIYWDETGPTLAHPISLRFFLWESSTKYLSGVCSYGIDGVAKYSVEAYCKDGAGGSGYTHKNEASYSSAHQGYKLQICKTDRYARFFTDEENAGVWTLQKTWELSCDYTIAKCLFITGCGEDVAYDHLFIDDIVLTPIGAGDTAEVTGLSNTECSKRLYGQGGFSIEKRDFELATYSTYKDYIWLPVEMWNDTLSKCLGEYYIIKPQFSYNKVYFRGPEALRVLDRVNARYNAILATGECTAVGADTIDDSNAAFTADMIGKFCFFSDKSGPSVETAYPDSGSDHKKVSDDNAATLYREVNTYSGLNDGSETWEAWFQKTVLNEYFYLQLDFATTNGGSATAFDIRCWLTFGGVSTDPSVYIYDHTNTQWRKIKDLSTSGHVAYELVLDEGDIPAGVIGDYFSGDGSPELWIKILSGENNTSSETLILFCRFAELKVTHSTPFVAETTQYTIDARTATQLTFTGQTPSADGVAIGDRYRIGDYLHTILEDCFAGGFSANLDLDCDTTTIADAPDFRSTYIGDILRSYAKLMNRKYFQETGWTVKVPSSYGDTGLNLTEADFVRDPTIDEWLLSRDGTDIIKHVQVLGNGIFVEGYQTPEYFSPQSLIFNENRLSSGPVAANYVTNLLASNIGPKDTLRFALDMDGSTDYSAIDIGKTVDINLYSGTITFTAGIITEIFYTQEQDGHLLATLTVEAA